MPTLKELELIRLNWLNKNVPYRMVYWKEFNYTILSNIIYRKRSGRGSNNSVNDAIIMLDTETSKKLHESIIDNHVVAWTISIRAFNRNIVTLYGHKPSSCIECITKIKTSMKGDETIIYVHNLSYDWVFLRKFFFIKYGLPDKQLNTKSHYPILIKWENGLTLKDSLILAQRSLDKWSKDLNVEHQKAIGKWDYDKIRNQDEIFSEDELEYIEHDTLAGVECIDATRQMLNKSLYSMPYTATGIPREDVRKLAKENHWHDRFLKIALNYNQYLKAEKVYHGGYTHANRHLIDTVITDGVTCYDFASSYPFVMLSEKYPIDKFMQMTDVEPDYILRNMKSHAYMFKLILVKPRLKNDFLPMPALQISKCEKTINAITDNGRILCAEYCEIYLTELDLIVIMEQYDFDIGWCTEVEVAKKDYLPRWFTDYIFKCFYNKTTFKDGDPVLYALAKAKLNSLYGMCVQKSIRDTINEDYLTGEYIQEEQDGEELYSTYLNNYNSVLNYQFGVWVTAYAFRNLFELGRCCETWVYSDTDSCYGINWNQEMLNQYNQTCKDKLKENGYGCVNFNGKEYWLGVAEYDGSYSEYVVQGAKRYCGRSTDDGELHITVAGVPKKGVKCLNNDIRNFTKGMIFSGNITGKLTHTYIYVDEIYIDSEGNETGDSINLTTCDYLLDNVSMVDWESIFEEEISIQVYDEVNYE